MQSLSTEVRTACVRVLAAALIAAMVATSLTLVSAPDASAAPQSVALVTRLVPVPGSDEPLLEHLVDSGWNVILVDDDDINNDGAAAVAGVDLVLISTSVYARRIEDTLASVATPIIVAEPTLFDDFGFTNGATGAQGETAATRKVEIVDASSPLVGGLSGTPTVAVKSKPMNYGKVAGDAHIAAVDPNAGGKAVLFSFESGATLASGETAAGRRVGLFMAQTTAKHANGDGWHLFDSAAAWATNSAPPVVGPTYFPPIAPSTGTHLGANVSKGKHPDRYVAVNALEDKIGRQLSIINRFHEFSSGLTSSFFYDRLHVADGRTVMISWRATDNPGSLHGEPDPNRANKIVNGQFDEEIDAMAIALRDLNAPVLLRFNWEMDQDVGKNQHIGTPAEYIAAWRYVHGRFASLDVANVEWVWSPRARSFSKDVGPTFYPGDAYVDWIGGSAVPITSFRDPQTIYGDWNEWASARNKPQLLWIGLRENPDDDRWKGDFIAELHNLTTGPWDGVKAFVYYHADSPKGYDYWVGTSTRARNKFIDLACDPHFATTFTC